MNKKLTTNTIILILCLMFFMSILLRFSFINFPKVISTYPDELRYFGIAKNIANGNGITFHHIASDFQKILYSLFILPAFWIPTTIHRQIQIIGLLNCFYMSLSAFPAYFLAKDIFKNHKRRTYYVLLIPALTLLMPDFVYTMTFMSEVIFLPLTLLFIHLIHKIFSTKDTSRKIVLNIFAGILLYVLYLNKEISLYFLIAYFLITCLQTLYKDSNKKNLWLTFFTFSSAFACLFVVFKMTLFSGLGSSYDQTSISAILSLHNFSFMIYGFIYSLFIIIIGFYFFPIFLPAFSLKKMERSQRELYLFLIFSLIIGAAVIAYTITVREDLDLRSPRQHLRYIIPLFIPLLMIMFNNFSLIKESLLKKKKQLIWITSGFALLFFIFIKDIPVGSHADQTALKYYVYFPKWLLSTFGIPHDTSLIILRLAIGLLLMVFVFLCIHLHVKNFLAAFTSILLLMNLINMGCCYHEYKNIYSISDEQVREMAAINDFCLNATGTVVGITSINFTAYDHLLDTYLTEDIYITSDYLLASNADAGSPFFDFETRNLNVKFPWQTYDDLDKADYLIASQDVRLENVEKIDIPYAINYSVYKNLDPSKIYYIYE